MAVKTMLFGPIGRQVSVPYPESGMQNEGGLKTEVTDLLTGEQAVWRAPLTYRHMNMSWKGQTPGLQPLIDVHAGMYGQGPFYISDPYAAMYGGNLLPTRWASCYQLGYVANGWGAPAIANQTLTPEGQQVTFTTQSTDPGEFPFPMVVPTVPGQPLYYKAWGSVTGTGAVRVYRYKQSTRAWTLDFTVTPTTANDAPTVLVSPTDASLGTYSAVKIVPYLPAGSTLTLAHMDVATLDYTTQTNKFRSGQGIGPVQFTGNTGGTTDSVTLDRIGLSLDVREVKRDPNN